jgi:hypothetical protein
MIPIVLLMAASLACSLPGSAVATDAVEAPDTSGQAAPTSAPTSPVEPEQPAELDPCAVQTQADAEALFGEAVGGGVFSQLGPFRVCTYEPVDGTGGTLSTMVWPGATISDFEATVAQTEQQMGAAALEVPGVGQGAYYLTGALHVYHDGYYLQYVLLKAMSDQEAIAAFSQLAISAIERLP